jgi:hypothetical protein
MGTDGIRLEPEKRKKWHPRKLQALLFQDVNIKDWSKSVE